MNWTGYEKWDDAKKYDAINEQRAQGLLSDTPGVLGLDALKEYYDYLYGPDGPNYWKTLPEWSDERMIEFERQFPGQMGLHGDVGNKFSPYLVDGIRGDPSPRGFDRQTGDRMLLNDMQFRLPREQGLLEYDRSPELANEEYRGIHEYPEHAPNTRQHHEVYNFLRRNNFGGGI